MNSIAMGVCSGGTCILEGVVRPGLAAALEARNALVASATRRRDRSAAQRGIDVTARRSYALAVLPRNTARSSRLPARRRAAFEQHLRNNLAEARGRLAAGDVSEPRYVEPTLESRSPAGLQAELALLGVGCAACRGSCCSKGHDHAFNSVDTMMQYLHAHPTDDDDSIVGRYMSWIGPRTMTGGCVFQQETGCSLPRDLRADICNRFYCDGLLMIRHRFSEGEPVRAYFVHRWKGGFTGDRFVDAGECQRER
jgi:hypothetical protein